MTTIGRGVEDVLETEGMETTLSVNNTRGAKRTKTQERKIVRGVAMWNTAIDMFIGKSDYKILCR